MVNMSAKFDKEIHNGLVSIMFTSLFPYLSIVTLTFDLWPPKSIGFILSSWLTCLPSLTKKHATVQSLSCSQGPCLDARMHTHTHTHGTTAALLYPHRNALRGDNKIANHHCIIFILMHKQKRPIYCDFCREFGYFTLKYQIVNIYI